jgi:NOL1/NOP2/fmu family ribosome biogenesis protein
MKEYSFKLGIGYDEEFNGPEAISELVQFSGDALSEKVKALPGVKWAGGDADEDPIIYELIVVGDISRNDIEAFLEYESNSNGSEGDLINWDFDSEVDYVNSGRPMDSMFASGGKFWIQKAITHPGALRKTAKAKGLIRTDKEKLSMTDLHKLEDMGGKTAKRAHLAETLKSFEGGGSLADRKDFYLHDKPELKERTKNRLEQISKMGMTEVGTAEFGVKGIMSGLYIERVWSDSDKDWNDYMDWAKSLINKPIESKRYPGQFTIGEDDGEKAMYTKEELELMKEGYVIELELNASRRGKAEMEAYQKEFKFETKLTQTDDEFGGRWRVWKKAEKLMIGGKLEKIPADELEAIYLQSEKSGQELDWVLKQYGYTMADFENSTKGKMMFAKGGPLVEEDETDTDYKLEYISNQIRQGNTSGYTPYWKLNTTIAIDDSDTEHIAELVEQGYHSGEIVSGNGNMGWWSVEVEDTFAGGGKVGQRIKMIKMSPDPHPIEPGTMGTIRLIDGLGQIHVNWDNGRGLAVIPGEDEYEIMGKKSEEEFLKDAYEGISDFFGTITPEKKVRAIKVLKDVFAEQKATYEKAVVLSAIFKANHSDQYKTMQGLLDIALSEEKMASGGSVEETLWLIGDGKPVKLKTGTPRSIKSFMTKNKLHTKYSGKAGLQSWPSNTTEEEVTKHNAAPKSSATSQEYSTGGAINFIKESGNGYSVHSRLFGGWNLQQNGMHIGKYSDGQVIEFAENIGYKK